MLAVFRKISLNFYEIKFETGQKYSSVHIEAFCSGFFANAHCLFTSHLRLNHYITVSVGRARDRRQCQFLQLSEDKQMILFIRFSLDMRFLLMYSEVERSLISLGISWERKLGKLVC